MAPPAVASASSAIDIWKSDADLEEHIREHEEKVRKARGWALIALAYSTCGVVYGDVGTSPLYTMAAVFPNGAPADDPNTILGTFCMIFWALTMVVLVKYIFIVLRADDNGEGGDFALYALICRACNIRVHATDLGLSKLQEEGREGRLGPRPRRRLAAKLRGWFETKPALQLGLLITVMVAACMVMSDGVLTPAISVISAIEGIQYNAGIPKGAVLGITCGIIIMLFILQTRGTERVSFLFSPFILTWLLANGAIGLYNIFKHDPSIFRALSPHYLYYFWAGQSNWAWQNLGHIMLAITGTEALYADMGHFSAAAIRLSFVCVVYPCLVLTYLGQTAFILHSPESASAAFWASQPSSLKWPMVVLATCAAIIASQALISGAFSIVQQAVAMSCFPRVKVKHTSVHVRGQVFIPTVNWLLMVGCVAVVLIFQSSGKIGNAYGLAVNMVELITTALVSLLMLMSWEWHPAFVGCFWLTFTFIESSFLSSNMTKVPKGAWFTLTLAFVMFVITYTWHWGQELKLSYIHKHAVPLRDLLSIEYHSLVDAWDAGGGKSNGQLEEKHQLGGGHGEKGDHSASAAGKPLPNAAKSSMAALGPVLRLGEDGPLVARVPGIGIYYNELLTGLSPVLVRFLGRMAALHKVAVILTLRSVPLPHIATEERLLIRKLHLPGFYHAVMRYGYMDSVRHDEQFVEHIMQEILEYLSPGMGFEEMSHYDADGSYHDSHHGSYFSRPSPWAPPASDSLPQPYPTSPTPGPASAMGTFHSYQGSVLAASLRRGLDGVWGAGGSTVHSREGADLAASIGHRLSRVSIPVGVDNSQGTARAGQSVTFTYINCQEEGGVTEGLPWVQQPSSFRRMRSLALESTTPAETASRTAALHDAIYGAATMPLPPPPPRPAIRIPLLHQRHLSAEEEVELVGAPRTVPLPQAPPRPTLGLLHRSSTSVEHRRRVLLHSPLSFPGAQGAGSAADPQLVRRHAPGPTIHEGIPQIPQEALTLAQSQQHYQQQSTPHQSPEGLAPFATPPQPEDLARSMASPAAVAGSTTQAASSGNVVPSDSLDVMPFLPPDAEGSTSPQGQLAALPGGSPTATKTTGSKSGRQRPQLPAWWTKKGRSLPSPSPDNSLSPAELKALARDLAAKLKEGQQSDDAELAAERDLEAGMTAGTAGAAGSIQLAGGMSTATPPTPAEESVAGADGAADTLTVTVVTHLGDDESTGRPSTASTAPSVAAAASTAAQGPSMAASGARAVPAVAATRRQIFTLTSVGLRSAQGGGPVEGSDSPKGVAGALATAAFPVGDFEASMAADREAVQEAYRQGPVAYLLGKSQLRAANRLAWFKVLMLEGFYAMLANNIQSTPASYHIPVEGMIELGVTYEV
ncbi:hypothetical protein N2152v2_010913 [Parachlorella kessleri]